MNRAGDDLEAIWRGITTRALAAEDARTPEQIAERARREAARSADDERRRLEGDKRRHIDNGIPARSVATVYGDLDVTTKAMLAAQRFVDEHGQSLVLAGGKGCGKSTAAAWAAMQIGGYFRHAPHLGTIMRDDEEKRRVLRCNLLVLDDLGMEYADEKGWFDSLLDELLVYRHDNLHRTVITTNLTRARFVKRYSERITDRLFEGAYVEIADATMRGAK